MARPKEMAYRKGLVMGSQGFVPGQLSPVNLIPKVHSLVTKGLLVPLSSLQVAHGFPNVSLQSPQL